MTASTMHRLVCRVAVVGPPGSGKSALVKALVGAGGAATAYPRRSPELSEDHPAVTIEDPVRMVRVTLVFEEGAGPGSECECELVVYDITDVKSFAQATRQAMGLPVSVLVGTKTDRVHDRGVSVSEGEQAAAARGMFFMETSSVDRTNVALVLKILRIRTVTRQLMASLGGDDGTDGAGGSVFENRSDGGTGACAKALSVCHKQGRESTDRSPTPPARPPRPQGAHRRSPSPGWSASGVSVAKESTPEPVVSERESPPSASANGFMNTPYAEGSTMSLSTLELAQLTHSPMDLAGTQGSKPASPPVSPIQHGSFTSVEGPSSAARDSLAQAAKRKAAPPSPVPDLAARTLPVVKPAKGRVTENVDKKGPVGGRERESPIEVVQSGGWESARGRSRSPPGGDVTCIDVDCGGGRVGTVRVRVGDDPSKVARLFARSMNLGMALVPVLAAQIRHRMVQEHARPVSAPPREGGEDGRRPVTKTDEFHFATLERVGSSRGSRRNARPVVLKMHVDVGCNRTGMMSVHKGESPDDAVKNFGRLYNMRPAAMQELADAVREILAEIEREKVLAGDVTSTPERADSSMPVFTANPAFEPRARQTPTIVLSMKDGETPPARSAPREAMCSVVLQPGQRGDVKKYRLQQGMTGSNLPYQHKRRYEEAHDFISSLRADNGAPPPSHDAPQSRSPSPTPRGTTPAALFGVDIEVAPGKVHRLFVYDGIKNSTLANDFVRHHGLHRDAVPGVLEILDREVAAFNDNTQ